MNIFYIDYKNNTVRSSFYDNIDNQKQFEQEMDEIHSILRSYN